MSDPRADRRARIAEPQRPLQDAHGSAVDRPHAGDRLRQFPLAVAGDAGDAENLALTHREGDLADRFLPPVAPHTEPRDLERSRLTPRYRPFHALRQLDVTPDHQRRQLA